MTKPASKTSERRSQNSIGCIAESAEQLDTGEAAASAVLPHLAEAGWPAVGVPSRLSGSGGDVVDAIAAIAYYAEPLSSDWNSLDDFKGSWKFREAIGAQLDEFVI